MKVSLSYHGGLTGSFSTILSNMLSRLNLSLAEAGMTSALGSWPRQYSMSSMTRGWSLRSILFMTTMTGQSSRCSLAT